MQLIIKIEGSETRIVEIEEEAFTIGRSLKNVDQPGVFIPLPRLDLHGKLLPIRSTGFWNGGPVS